MENFGIDINQGMRPIDYADRNHAYLAETFMIIAKAAAVDMDGKLLAYNLPAPVAVALAGAALALCKADRQGLVDYLNQNLKRSFLLDWDVMIPGIISK